MGLIDANTLLRHKRKMNGIPAMQTVKHFGLEEGDDKGQNFKSLGHLLPLPFVIYYNHPEGYTPIPLYYLFSSLSKGSASDMRPFLGQARNPSGSSYILGYSVEVAHGTLTPTVWVQIPVSQPYDFLVQRQISLRHQSRRSGFKSLRSHQCIVNMPFSKIITEPGLTSLEGISFLQGEVLSEKYYSI